MQRKRHSPEQIIRKLREADAELAAGNGNIIAEPPCPRRNRLGKLPHAKGPGNTNRQRRSVKPRRLAPRPE